MSLVSRAVYGANEKRTLTAPIFGIPWGGAAPGDDNYSSGGAMGLTTFFRCVSLLADITGSLPLRAYKGTDQVLVLTDKQPALLANLPYPNMTWRDWLWMLVESLAVTGNAFCLITARDKDHKATSLMPISPALISVSEDGPWGWLEPVYRINGKQYDSSDIVHIKRFPVSGYAMGMSPVQKMSGALGLAQFAEDYGRRWFKDSATPSGLLTTDQELTELQAKSTLRRWIQGNKNRRLPAVLGSGMKWQSVTITPNESQFLETRAFQRGEIAMWFGIPPHMIGDTEKSTSWGEGIDAQKDGFVTFTLTGWLNPIEEIISLLLPRGMSAKFDLKELLRGDPAVRWETTQVGILAGVLSINEGRAMNDLPPIPEGDIRLQPMNYVPLGTPVSEYVGKGTSTEDKPPATGGKDKK